MNRTPFHVVFLVAVVAVALTGCSRMPTAPSVDATSAVVATPGSAPVVIGQVDDPPSPVTSGNGALGHITLPVGQAGIITYGQFTLFIHKNSLKMPATITMVQPDLNVMEVEFQVSPPEANDFQVPLKLVANCAPDSPAVVQQETAFLWDGTWTPVAKQQVDTNGVTITTSLHALETTKIANSDTSFGTKTGN